MSDRYTPHRFNPYIANVYGINSALIYQYLNYRSSVTPGRFVDVTLAELREQYPYLGEWQVWAALQNLINVGKTTPPLILRKQVGGVYKYAPVADDNSDLGSLHTFDANVAIEVGVVAAIIFHNVSYWIKRNWQRQAEEVYRYLDPVAFDDSDYAMQRFAYQKTRLAAAHYTTITEWLETHRYVSKRSAERGFSCLQQAKLLTSGRTRRNKPTWYLPRHLLCQFQQDMLDKSTLEITTAKTQSTPPKPKTHRQNPSATAKTQRKQGLSDCPPNSTSAFEEVHIEKAALRVVKQVEDNPDAFRQSTLADARGDTAGTASMAAAPRSPSVRPKADRSLREMNQQNYPRGKTKVLRDSYGHPVKRQYTHKPKLDDDDFELYIDNLTPEARREYLASLRE